MKLYPKYKVKIVFKSGYIHVGWYWKFEGEYKGDKMTSLSWKCVGYSPSFNYIDLSQIETIYILKQKKVFRFKSPLN